ncbi:neurofibromin [Anaeramoeba flamelloides]|uniref:Neurofibromin n=1 Tax=Anaeramoeba flamelloides TaxID=1746091 RepID=A0ABQ8XX94_9EUKA|nr:neurofibromin [Anaeramoeba flamelloides]
MIMTVVIIVYIIENVTKIAYKLSIIKSNSYADPFTNYEEYIHFCKNVETSTQFPQDILKKCYEDLFLKPVPFFASDLNSILIKQGGKIKTWKKRWFVFTNECIYYYQTINAKHPLGIIPLSGIEVKKGKQPPKSKKGYQFLIVKTGNEEKFGYKKKKSKKSKRGNHKNYLISASSKEEYQEWIQKKFISLYNNVNKNKEMLTKVNYGKHIETITPTYDPPQLFTLKKFFLTSPKKLPLFPFYKSSVLTKLGRTNGKWRKRYFVLNGQYLHYYGGDPFSVETSEISRIDLSTVYTLESVPEGLYSRKYCFRLFVPIQQRYFLLQASCEEEKDDWVSVLSLFISINKLVARPTRKSDSVIFQHLIYWLDSAERNLETQINELKTILRENLELKLLPANFINEQIQRCVSMKKDVSKWNELFILKKFLISSKPIRKYKRFVLANKTNKLTEKDNENGNWLQFEKWDVIIILDESSDFQWVGLLDEQIGYVNPEFCSIIQTKKCKKKLLKKLTDKFLYTSKDDFNKIVKKTNRNSTNNTTLTTTAVINTNNRTTSLNNTNNSYNSNFINNTTTTATTTGNIVVTATFTNNFNDKKKKINEFGEYYKNLNLSKFGKLIKYDATKSFRKNNKNGYFGIYDYKLYCFSSKENTESNEIINLKEILSLKNVSSITNQKWIFEIITKSNSIIFKCNDKENYEEWYDFFSNLLTINLYSEPIARQMISFQKKELPKLIIFLDNLIKNERQNYQLNKKKFDENLNIIQLNIKLGNKFKLDPKKNHYKHCLRDLLEINTLQNLFLIKELNNIREIIFSILGRLYYPTIKKTKYLAYSLTEFEKIKNINKENIKNFSLNSQHFFPIIIDSLGTNKLKLNLGDAVYEINREGKDIEIINLAPQFSVFLKKSMHTLSNKRYSFLCSTDYLLSSNELHSIRYQTSPVLSNTFKNKRASEQRQLIFKLLEENRLTEKHNLQFPIFKKGFLYLNEQHDTKLMKYWCVVRGWFFGIYENSKSLQPINAFDLRQILSIEKINLNKVEKDFTTFIIKFKIGNELILGMNDKHIMMNWIDNFFRIKTFHILTQVSFLSENKNERNKKYIKTIFWLRDQILNKNEMLLNLKQFLKSNIEDRINLTEGRDPNEDINNLNQQLNNLKIWYNKFLSNYCRFNIDDSKDNRQRVFIINDDSTTISNNNSKNKKDNNKENNNNDDNNKENNINKENNNDHNKGNNNNNNNNMIDNKNNNNINTKKKQKKTTQFLVKKGDLFLLIEKLSNGLVKIQNGENKEIGYINGTNIQIIKPSAAEKIIKTNTNQNISIKLNKDYQLKRINYGLLLKTTKKNLNINDNNDKNNKKNNYIQNKKFLRTLPLFYESDFKKPVQGVHNKWIKRTLVLIEWDLIILNKKKIEEIIDLNSLKNFETIKLHFILSLNFDKINFLLKFENEKNYLIWLNLLNLVIILNDITQPINNLTNYDPNQIVLIQWLECEVANIKFQNSEFFKELLKTSNEKNNQYNKLIELNINWIEHLLEWRYWLLQRFCRVNILFQNKNNHKNNNKKNNENENDQFNEKELLDNQYRVFCLQTYKAQNKNELSVHQNEFLIFIQKVDRNYQVKNAKNKMGEISPSKVEIIKPEIINLNNFYKNNNNNTKYTKSTGNGGILNLQYLSNYSQRELNKQIRNNLNRLSIDKRIEISNTLIKYWESNIEQILNYPIICRGYLESTFFSSKNNSLIRFCELKSWLLFIYLSDEKDKLIQVFDLRDTKSIQKVQNEKNENTFAFQLNTSSFSEIFYLKSENGLENWIINLNIIKIFNLFLSPIQYFEKNKLRLLKYNKLYNWSLDQIILINNEKASNEYLFQYYNENEDQLAIKNLEKLIIESNNRTIHLNIWKKRLLSEMTRLKFENNEIQLNGKFKNYTHFGFTKKDFNEKDSLNEIENNNGGGDDNDGVVDKEERVKKNQLVPFKQGNWFLVLEKENKKLSNFLFVQKSDDINNYGNINIQSIDLISKQLIKKQIVFNFINFNLKNQEKFYMIINNNNNENNNNNNNTNNNTNNRNNYRNSMNLGNNQNDDDDEDDDDDDENYNDDDDDEDDDDDLDWGKKIINNPPIQKKQYIYYFKSSKLTNNWIKVYLKINGYNLHIIKNKINNQPIERINLFNKFKFNYLEANNIPLVNNLNSDNYKFNCFEIFINQKSYKFSVKNVDVKKQFFDYFNVLKNFSKFQKSVNLNNNLLKEKLQLKKLIYWIDKQINENIKKCKTLQQQLILYIQKKESFLSETFISLENDIDKIILKICNLKGWKIKILKRLLRIKIQLKEIILNNENKDNVNNISANVNNNNNNSSSSSNSSSNNNSNSSNSNSNNMEENNIQMGYLLENVTIDDETFEKGDWVKLKFNNYQIKKNNFENIKEGIIILKNQKEFSISVNKILIIKPSKIKKISFDNQNNQNKNAEVLKEKESIFNKMNFFKKTHINSSNNKQVTNLNSTNEEENIIILTTEQFLLKNLILTNFKFFHILYEIIDIADMDLVSRSLVILSLSKNITLQFLDIAIIKEIDLNEIENTLFRGNNLATKMMSFFARKVGSVYLKGILNHVIDEIIDNDYSFEIREAKLTQFDNIEENLKSLTNYVSKILNIILNSVQFIPLYFRELCWKLFYLVSKKFPNAKYIVLSSFLFLRFICPSIIVPEKMGITEKIPTKNSRNSLILISKIIQNVANRIHFKQSEFAPLNPLCDEFIPKIEIFLNKVVQPCFVTKLKDNINMNNLNMKNDNIINHNNDVIENMNMNKEILIISKKNDKQFLACVGKNLSQNKNHIFDVSLSQLQINYRHFNIEIENSKILDQELNSSIEKLFNLLSNPTIIKNILKKIENEKILLQQFQAIFKKYF